ncbi:hypothetical protein Goklo_018243 [Gossypium klotzschianum]|uniref:Uncharacterized protein n=1 Tax=Gossypium klotzschianum TaxID=34286 RepID=A0A7J8UK48_9ROSI|nr:hypothetical protein [Gossypium klotzschianum]
MKEPIKIFSTFAPALNQPLSHDDRLFLMSPLSAPQKLKVKVGKNPYANSANPHFHPFRGKGKASVQLSPKEEEVNNYDIRHDKGLGPRQIGVREPQNHHPYNYKDQKSLLQALVVDFLGEQKTKTGFLRLGTSSGRTPPNFAPNPTLRNHQMEQVELAAAPSQASSLRNCDNLNIELRLGFE